MIDAVEVRNLVTAILALSAAVGCIAYAATNQRRKAKRPVYLVAGLGFLYWTVVYLYGALGEPVYLIRSGWLGAIGYYLIVATFLALLITDWRRTNDRS